MILRLLLAGLSLLATAPAVAHAQTAPAAVTTASGEIAMQHVSLPSPDGRTIPLNVWPAAQEKGVVVFSHGFHGSPGACHRILAAWAAHGYTVMAPLHVDSREHPDQALYDSRQAFRTRLMDLAVTRAYARMSHPGKPLIAAGHSFGSLMAMIEAGAVTAAGPLGDPDVRGVIAFSSTGDLPTVIRDTTWDGLTGPLLMITGDRDQDPGAVDGWTVHRLPYDRSPAGDKTLMVFAGGDHELVDRADEADFALIVEATGAFLDAYALNDAAAKARLNALPSSADAALERR